MSTLTKITQVSGKAVPIPGDDIDTDRIIPARFMKCVTFDGLGEYAFYDARFETDGQTKKNHPLNDARYADATILLVGSNFGCGSSREHAPQSLFRYGIRGIIGLSFAEIFFGNCTTLGIPCAVVTAADLEKLRVLVEADPTLELKIDIQDQVVHIGDTVISAQIEPSAREGLIKGEWDPISLMLKNPEAIDALVGKLYPAH